MAGNVGGMDKVVRIIAGAGLIGATVAGLLPMWGYIGIVPLATGLMGWCPAYTLLGMNSCSVYQVLGQLWCLSLYFAHCDRFNILTKQSVNCSFTRCNICFVTL